MKNNDFNLPISYLFKDQFQHLMLLILLVCGAFFLAEPTLDGGSWLGISDRTWFSAGVAAAVVHQILGWFVFRTQLVFNLVVRLFGKAALPVWGIIFFPFLIARPILVAAVGFSDLNSIDLPQPLLIILGILLLIPSLYSMHSVVKYFGIPRALGGDHFYQKYREMPLVVKGAYKYTSNAMYGLVFLGLWSIGLLTGSRAAVVLALFQHAYIWVHMYCTEQPDMAVIYGKKNQ